MFLRLFCFVSLTSSATLAWRWTSKWPSRDVVSSELVLSAGASLVMPGDEKYYDLTLMKSRDFTRTPGAIALVKNKEDVQKCILFARKYYLQVAIRSSGHCLVGRSTADNSLLIDLSQMKNIKVNPNDTGSDTGASAFVEPGNSLIEIYKEVDKYGLIAVGGHAHTVTIGGYTVGGGHSVLTKMLGLGVDSVLQFTIVTAKGEIVTANATSTVVQKRNGRTETIKSGDIFWAVRGGGSAFGVVTEFKIKLHKAPESFVSLYASIPLENLQAQPARDFLYFYKDFLKNNMTDKWGGYLVTDNRQVEVSETPKIISNGSMRLFLLHFGGWEQAMSSIKPLTDFISPPGRPLEIKGIWRANNISSFYEYAKAATQQTYTYTYVISRLIQEEDFIPGFITLMTDGIKSSKLFLHCNAIHVGGKASKVDPGTSSVNKSLRTAKWSLMCGTLWRHQSEKPTVMKSIHSFREELYKYGKGQYYNEPDYHTPDWPQEFWGDNYGRLQEVKRKWDPENFFTCHMCVTIDVKEPRPPTCRAPFRLG